MTTTTAAPGAPISLIHGVTSPTAPRRHEHDVEEAAMSPLLLDSPERRIADEIHDHDATMEQERRQFEEEARVVRRYRRTYCCFATLIFFSFLPTWVVVASVSPLALILCIFFVVRFSHRFRNPSSQSKISWLALTPILLVNVGSMYLYDRMFGYDNFLTFSLISAMLGSTGVYYLQQHQNQPPCCGHPININMAEQEDHFRQKQLFFTYLETVQSVANKVRHGKGINNSCNESATELREFHPPLEGFYEGITVLPKKPTKKLQSPSRNNPVSNHDNTTNITTATAETTKTDDGQLFLLFPRCDSATGWWIRGARKQIHTDDNNNQSINIQSSIVEGFVSPSHEAYWTEGTLDGKDNTLYYGKFALDQGKQTFAGEWLSFTGNRSHQYSLSLQTAADPLHHLGLTCEACQRNPHPGKCYISKPITTPAAMTPATTDDDASNHSKAASNSIAFNEKYYCETCVANDPGLVHHSNETNNQEEGFIELSLPDVNLRANEKSYSPPLSP